MATRSPAAPLVWKAGAALAVAGAALVLLLVVVLSIVAATAAAGACSEAGAELSTEPVGDGQIPADYARLYAQAAADYELGPHGVAIIAAIGKIESSHGQSRKPGVHSGQNFHGCCAGPMQFHNDYGSGGGTWGAYAVDGDGDGQKDIYDPADAIPAAARYLRASGAPGDWRRAIFAYNHASWYVADVLALAERYARGGLESLAAEAPSAAECNIDEQLAGEGDPDAEALLRNRRIVLDTHARADLRAGRISPRLIALLDLITRDHTITISVLSLGHAPGTNHEPGRAADIAVVDGEVCNSNAHGRSGACWVLAQELDRLRGCMHPTELIYGIDPGSSPDSWGAADHTDHIHAGWDGPRGSTVTYDVSITACSPRALTG